MKICCICHVEKESSLFYKDKSRFDGYSYRCKDCDKVRDKLRIRINHAKYQQVWKEKNIKKYEAHKALKRAVYNNVVIKTQCFVCGNNKVEAHHPDYDRPLDVIWMCRQHHRETHQMLIVN